MDQNNDNTKFQGLGGWLIIVSLGLIITPINLGVLLYRSGGPLLKNGLLQSLSSPTSQYYNPSLFTLITAETFINGLLLILSIWLIVIFFLKKPAFPKLFIGVVTASLVYTIGDVWAASLVLPDEPVFDADTVKSLTQNTVRFLIWVPYMIVSKRVKATFVKNTVPADTTANIPEV